MEPSIIVEADLHVEDIEPQPQTPAQTHVVPIKPPVSLFKPVEYPALHIFVSFQVRYFV